MSALTAVGGTGGAPPEVPPPFEVRAVRVGEDFELHWVNRPTDPDAPLEEFEQDARARLQLLDKWLARLWSLVCSVDSWAKELGWSTRVVEKPMEDSQVGQYAAHGLLLQEGVDRILLEPVGRSSPGTEGIVDLYLLPAYDDIATLYFYGYRWNLHYAPSGTAATATPREAQSKPLSKDSLREVLAQMRQHAA